MRQTLLQMINLMRLSSTNMQARKMVLAAIAVVVWHTPTTCNYTVPFYKKLKRKRTLNGPRKQKEKPLK